MRLNARRIDREMNQSGPGTALTCVPRVPVIFRTYLNSERHSELCVLRVSGAHEKSRFIIHTPEDVGCYGALANTCILDYTL